MSPLVNKTSWGEPLANISNATYHISNATYEEYCEEFLRDAIGFTSSSIFVVVFTVIALVRIRGKNVDTGFSVALAAVLISCAEKDDFKELFILYTVVVPITLSKMTPLPYLCMAVSPVAVGDQFPYGILTGSCLQSLAWLRLPFLIFFLFVMYPFPGQAIANVEYYIQAVFDANGHHHLKNPYVPFTMGFTVFMFLSQRSFTVVCSGAGAWCMRTGRTTNLVAVLIALASFAILCGLLSIPEFTAYELTATSDYCGHKMPEMNGVVISEEVKIVYDGVIHIVFPLLSLILETIILTFLIRSGALRSESESETSHIPTNMVFVKNITFSVVILACLIELLTVIYYTYLYAHVWMNPLDFYVYWSADYVYALYVLEKTVFLQCFSLAILFFTRPAYREVIEWFERGKSQLTRDALELRTWVDQVRRNGWRSMLDGQNRSDASPLVNDDSYFDD